VLILLPPSEGKSAPQRGAPVKLEHLTYPSLAESRRRIGDALAKVSGQRNALQVLGVGASLAEDVARNVTVWSNPADAAARVYSGVLYDAAGAAQWYAATLTRASTSVRIISALWGAVSPADPIPAYRLSMSTPLGRIGPLAAWWRPRLTPLLDADSNGGLVVDCRSAPYVAAYRPTQSRWVSVVVERELAGKRTVVSHTAKHTRGLLVRHLVDNDLHPQSRQDLADAAAEMIGGALIDVSLEGDRLTLVTSEGG
jgi:cytoplasmic iron level regulating protein YaaA (DUF328/UPF0246 family)